MDISLRRANSIQHQIQEVIASIRIVGIIDLSEFHNIEAELQQANIELFNNDARRQRLLLAFYTIRGLVGAANAASGVDINLAKAAFLDKRVAQLHDITRLDAATRLGIIQGRIEKIKKGSDHQDVYGRSVSTVSTTVVSEEQIKQARTEIMNLKRQRQRLLDEVLELNVKTEIPLNEDVVKTLTDEGIL
jgi:hypothetical protein